MVQQQHGKHHLDDDFDYLLFVHLFKFIFMANSVTDKLILSASTDGKGIKIAATATAGTLVHT